MSLGVGESEEVKGETRANHGWGREGGKLCLTSIGNTSVLHTWYSEVYV